MENNTPAKTLLPYLFYSPILLSFDLVFSYSTEIERPTSPPLARKARRPVNVQQRLHRKLYILPFIPRSVLHSHANGDSRAGKLLELGASTGAASSCSHMHQYHFVRSQWVWIKGRR